MTDTIPFAQFLVDSQRTPTLWLLYRFPSGQSASVITDPRWPLRFEMEVDRAGTGSIVTAGMTTDEVDAKLAELAQA